VRIDLPPSLGARLCVNGNDDTLATETLRCRSNGLGILNRRRIQRHLIGSCHQQTTNILDAANTAADRQRHETTLRRARDDVEEDVTVLVGGRDVEEDEFIRSFFVVSLRNLNGVTCVAKFYEMDALDNPSCFYVETRNDAFC